MRLITYGEGGYDATKPDNNLVSDKELTQSPEQTNKDTLETQARAALENNRAFLALTSPSNAQVVAQVKALTRQNQALIRAFLNDYGGTD